MGDTQVPQPNQEAGIPWEVCYQEAAAALGDAEVKLRLRGHQINALSTDLTNVLARLRQLDEASFDAALQTLMSPGHAVPLRIPDLDRHASTESNSAQTAEG